MRHVIVAIALAFSTVACGQPLPAGDRAAERAADPIENFGPDDATMNAAIAEARASLPRFWEMFDARDGSDFMLKVGFPTPDGGNEHIWVGDIQRAPNGALSAVIANEPHDVPSIRFGERANFEQAWISDWALTRNGQMYGHYTTRVVVGSLPPEEQAQYAGFLAGIAQGVP